MSFCKKPNINQCILMLFFASVFIFFIWTASSDGEPFRFKFYKEAHSRQYHQLLADAFIHGQLHLMFNPPAEMLALPDPYDPVQNERYRLNINQVVHDMSLYNGHYYLYFTPVPALLFMVPIKFVFGVFFQEDLLTAMLCFVGFLFSFLALQRLLRLSIPEPSAGTMLVAALSLATATTVPFLLRRIAVYELSIASAYAFMMMGTYFLLRVLLPESQRKKKMQLLQLGFAGFLLGFGMWSRPVQLFACGLLVLAFFVVRIFFFREKIRMLIPYFVVLIAPLLMIGIVMCWYNYTRFGSIFEFGTSYMLSAVHARRAVIMSVLCIPLDVYNYIFQPVRFNLTFPFFHTQSMGGLDYNPFPWPYSFEPVLGLINFPVYWLIIIPLCCIRYIWQRAPVLMIVSAFMLAAGVCSLLAVSIISGATMRYLVDFTPMILLATLSLFLVSRDMVFSSSYPGQTISKVSFVLPVMLGALIAISTSLTGYFNMLESCNPILYNKIKKMFTFDLYGEQPSVNHKGYGLLGRFPVTAIEKEDNKH